MSTTRLDRRTNTRRATAYLVLLALLTLPTSVLASGDGKTVDALGHVVDGDVLEVPFGEIHLGAIQLGGYSLPRGSGVDLPESLGVRVAASPFGSFH